MIDIKEITDPTIFIKNFAWIQECNFTEITPELVLAKCLTGEYFCYAGFKDESFKGFIICKKYDTMCFIVGLYVKNNLKAFVDQFLILLKKIGYEKIRTSANFDEEAYSRLTGMKKLWTVYERIL